MDETLLSKLAHRKGVVPSLGDSSFVSAPDGKRAIEVAVVHLHRFAFNYWLKWATENWTKSLPTDSSAPDLITIDYHDDVGIRSDCVVDELDLLVGKLEIDDTNDKKELDRASNERRNSERNVAIYSALGLRPLNDGHIYPAQFLNAIGDVFVLYKQREPCERSLTDKNGRKHCIRYFNDTEKLLYAINEKPFQRTILDLDVDYFFDDGKDVRGAETMIDPKKIREFLNPESELMSTILFRNLQGITFAIEPSYCGGLAGCFKAMSIIMEAMFSGSLLSHKVSLRL